MEAKGSFRYTRKDTWPPLAWVAHCPRGSNTVRVQHGRRVETRPEWFCEAVWAGEFSAGDFDQTDIVSGSGARWCDGALVFVPSGSTTDRLQYFQDETGLWISNSLCALLLAIGAQVDPTYPYYDVDFDSIMEGLHAFKRELATSRGPVRFVYFHNLRWDGHEASERPKPLAARDFSSFDRFYAFLASSMQAFAENARDGRRAHPYELLCALSNGYDSPTVAVLARRAGCTKAFSFDVSREGTDDSGARIGQLLGLETTVISRDAWRQVPLAEVPFIAGAANAGEVIFKGAEALLGGTVLLTGLGTSWGSSPPRPGSEHLLRQEASGLCLTEYRLHVGFLHCPVAFWGARQRQEIFAINESAEMQPWAFAGERPRGKPIPRRIVEEAGVPREWFGRGRQRGVSVQLMRPRQFLAPRTEQDYYRWLAEHADEWRRRGRHRPRPTLALLIDYILWAGVGVLGFLAGLKGADRFPAGHRLVRRLRTRAVLPLYIRRYTFPWALERTQERYR